MSDTGPRTPNADGARADKGGAKGGAPAAGGVGGERPAAGGVRRLTDADAKGRGRRGRLTDEDADLPQSRPLAQNAGIVVGAFAGGTVIAELLGAANLGTAMSFGQIAFAIALVYVLLRR